MIIFLLLRHAAACRLPFGAGRKREAKSLYLLFKRQIHTLHALNISLSKQSFFCYIIKP